MTSATDDPVFAREEHETGFTAILQRLVRATPGAIGAAMVDGEGEAVDYAGDRIDPFELKVAAAHWRIVMRELEDGGLAKQAGPPRRLLVETSRRVFVLDALPEGYALLSVLQRDAGIGHADRALDVALRELYQEAGWSAPPDLFRWHEVEVQVGEGERPSAVHVGRRWEPVRVIGKVANGLRRDEIGFRVGCEAAHCELTLVRGLDGRWYADLPPDSIRPPPAAPNGGIREP